MRRREESIVTRWSRARGGGGDVLRVLGNNAKLIRVASTTKRTVDRREAVAVAAGRLLLFLCASGAQQSVTLRRCQGLRRMSSSSSSLYRDLLGYLRICYKAVRAK